MNSEHMNAVAGPSNLYASPTASSHTFASPAAPHSSALFLPPPAPPPPKQHLASTQDLLGRFRLHSAYDKYVRPFTLPGNESALDGGAPGSPDGSGMPTTPGAVDKGKGREMDMGGMAQDADADDDDAPGGKGEKKKKNSYKHLIKGVPGKHSMKKDDYLTTMMLVPPKQRMHISPFDLKTQKDAFAVTLEGLKGWNINALVLESAQAREDRKKRKELKRLAKAQQALGSGAPTPIALAHPQPIQAPIPAPLPPASASGTPLRQHPDTSISRPATGTGTPQRAGAGTPRPSSTVARPGSAVPRPGSTSTVPRPGSTTSAVPRPGSAVPRPGSAAGQGKPLLPHVQVPSGRVGTPLRAGTPTSAVEQRGMKREREDVVLGGGNANGHANGQANPNPNPNAMAGVVGYSAVNGGGVNGNANGNGNVPAKGVANAKAGVAGVRPRPIKKQRVDVQGQARDVSAPVQQPTPQGV